MKSRNCQVKTVNTENKRKQGKRAIQQVDISITSEQPALIECQPAFSHSIKVTSIAHLPPVNSPQ